MAKKFSNGNTLFVIHMKQPQASEQGLSIASLSRFSREEEVLLRPSVQFTVVNREEGQKGFHQVIHVDILSPPGSRSNQ